MNIFVLDNDPRIAATYLCDKHICKMLLESAQLLCNQFEGFSYKAPYKPTHTRHMCSLWVHNDVRNFRWLAAHAFGMHDEWRLRFGHPLTEIHKSIEVVQWCLDRESDVFPYCSKVTTSAPKGFVQCMPAQYRQPDPVAAYRAYYIGEKQHFAEWRHSDKPHWYPQQYAPKWL